MKNSLVPVSVLMLIGTLVPLRALGQSVSVTAVNLSPGSPSHGSANITVGYTGSPTALRFRVALPPASCTSGTGGYTVGSADGQYAIRANPEQESVGGLLPSTTYQVCPEISADGVNWYGGVGTTFTTLPLPNPHPALPVAPVSFNTDYPDTTSYATYNLNSSCLDVANGNSLQQDLNAALANQGNQGSIISIAAGAVCRGQISLWQQAADLVTLSSAAVNTSTSQITVAANSFNEGDIFVCGNNYGACPSPILPGQNYAVHVVDATHIQLFFPLPQALGGSLVTLTSGGSTFYYYRRSNVTWGQNYGQRNLNWIVIRPSTPDSQFVPEHTRIQGPLDQSGHPTPPASWLPKMYTITMANTYQGVASVNQLFILSNQDRNDESMNGYIRVVGAHFTFDPSLDTSGGKPITHYGMIGSSQWNSDFVVDRCWLDPPGHPDEETGLLHFNGTNVALIDSYSDNFDYYHPAATGYANTSASGTQINIGAGTYSFGNGTVNSPNITATVSGSVSGTQSGWIYYPDTHTLHIALPPGLSPGTCTTPGITCREYTLSGQQTGYYNGPETSITFPNSDAGTAGVTYMIEPVTGASAACSSTQALFPAQWYNQAATLYNLFSSPGNTYDVATRFSTDSVAPYFCGWQVFIPPQDTATTHVFTLWSDSGSAIYQQTLKGQVSGKVFVPAATPQLLNANTSYRAGYQFTGYDVQWSGAFQNYDPNGGLTGTVHASQYAPATVASLPSTASNYADAWPKTFDNRNAVGMSLVFFASGGNLTGLVGSDLFSDGINTEGCQCMVSGLGPGPFVFKNNYTVGSGNMWHFDDGGGYALSRHDYTIFRNWWYAPLTYMFTSDGSNPLSDGMRHGHRHSLEWKQGNCAALVGNIFDTSWVEDTPFGDLFEASGINGTTGVCGTSNQLIYGSTSDFDIRSNTFAHAASVNSVFGPTPGSVGVNPRRFRFTNNLMVDISGTKYCAIGISFCPNAAFGSGLIFQTAQLEDFTMTHNTMVGNNAGSRLPFLFLSSIDNQEGFNVRDNILWINGTSNGLGGISADTCGYTNGTDATCWGMGTWCKALDGLVGFNCAYANSTWMNNLMTGSPTQAQIQALWPNDIVPSQPSNLAGIGWSSYSSPSAVGNYSLISNSPYISGGPHPASDGLNVGLDYDRLQADQGYVTLTGVSNITRTSAQINFVAPDSQACPVDYSPTDPTVTDNTLVRVPDIGSVRARNVTINGLAGGQVYYFRVNCAVNQPTGQFKTQ